MFCDNCGKVIPDNSPACPYCGQTFSTPTSEAPTPTTAPRVPGSYGRVPQPAAGGPFMVIPIFRLTLGALERGKIIRAGVAMALRILGVFALLAGVFMVIGTLKIAFDLPASAATLGGILATALLGAAVFAVFQILFYRADSVSRLPDSQFTVMPVFSFLFRAWGESFATFATTLGVAGCLFTWFSDLSISRLLQSSLPILSLPVEGGFIGGLLFLAMMAMLAFGTLILSYFLAESVIVVADISRNTGLLVKASGVSESAN
jgi:zinc-ribbon domain